MAGRFLVRIDAGVQPGATNGCGFLWNRLSPEFRYTRQPVYLAFALTLWTGPVWTPDKLVLALLWTAYCIVGPRFKERRYLQYYGEEFERYRESVPYWLPRKRRDR